MFHFGGVPPKPTTPYPYKIISPKEDNKKEIKIQSPWGPQVHTSPEGELPLDQNIEKIQSLGVFSKLSEKNGKKIKSKSNFMVSDLFDAFILSDEAKLKKKNEFNIDPFFKLNQKTEDLLQMDEKMASALFDNTGDDAVKIRIEIVLSPVRTGKKLLVESVVILNAPSTFLEDLTKTGGESSIVVKKVKEIRSFLNNL